MEKKDKEQKICSKCGEANYCDEHHILPKTIFGVGETRPLCKTCHDKFHRFLGFKFLRKKDAQPKEFYIERWIKWISLLVVVGIIFCVTYF